MAATLPTHTAHLWPSNLQGFQLIDFHVTKCSVHIKTRILAERYDGQEVWESVRKLCLQRHGACQHS